jgi:hypothetical protein
MFSNGDVQKLADEVVGVAHEFLDCEVRSEGDGFGWQVRLEAKAFDYFGAIWVRPGDSRMNKATELAGCIDQIAQSILCGRAKHREGYPVSFTEAE